LEIKVWVTHPGKKLRLGNSTAEEDKSPTFSREHRNRTRNKAPALYMLGRPPYYFFLLLCILTEANFVFSP
jgi:hypothetical protein